MFALFAVEKHCKTHILFFVNAAKEKYIETVLPYRMMSFYSSKIVQLGFCKLRNDSIFPFNHIEDDYEFTMTLDQFMNDTLIQRTEFQHPGSMIFDTFEINEDEDQIV